MQGVRELSFHIQILLPIDFPLQQGIGSFLHKRKWHNQNYRINGIKYYMYNLIKIYSIFII